MWLYMFVEPKVENTAACDPGWFAYGDACFYLSPKAAEDWDDAQEQCEDQGGELASCLSKWEAYHFGIKHAYSTEDSDLATYYWIGLRDRYKHIRNAFQLRILLGS